MPDAAVMADCGLLPDLHGNTLEAVFSWGVALLEYGEQCALLNEAKGKAIGEMVK